MAHSKFFGNLDFDTVPNDPTFKEAAVRTFIIDPIIKELGYTSENIVLEKTVQIQTGSKKQTTPYFADYALKIGNSYSCIIEAKSPDKNIADSALIDQAFFYASHREIRSKYFALCNGIDFCLYRTDVDRTLVLHFHLSEIDSYWMKLKTYLAPESFLAGKETQYTVPKKDSNKKKFDEQSYCCERLLEEIPCRKQAAKRHFGCNAYFTRQTWNVVAEYIRNYTKPGDLVLDPYGGSGITAIEALLNDRRAIHLDLNPLCVFLADTLLAPASTAEINEALESICIEYDKKIPKTKKEIKEAIAKYKQPADLPLPKNADVKSVHKLFSSRQRAQLSLLKTLIKKQKNKNVQKSLMLAFYNTITVCNLTFHETPQGGGNHFGFYYRYRMAREPAERDVLDVFKSKVKRVIDGKQEMSIFGYVQRLDDIQIVKGTATDLSFLKNESVDYIYTDPPYGKKIQYLDLSAMWNAWLDFDVTEEDYKLEAIEDGKLDKSKAEYKKLIADSIREMFRVLKFDRWLSFVFAHKDPEFWDLIINTAEQCGFEYVGAVPQKNGQTSFKKRQHPFTVLSGQLIINFRKTKSPRAIMKANLGTNLAEIVIQTIEGIIAKHGGATLEQINDELIIRGLELGFLDLLAKEYNDLTPFLLQHFSYDTETEMYAIPHNRGFKSHLDVRLRIRYYLIPFLTRCEREGEDARFDDIVRTIMPLLKNGSTPGDQTILSVLEDIGERYGDGCWRLKPDRPETFELFR